MNLEIAISLLWKGMLGIFAVMILVAVIVWLLGRFDANNAQ